MFDFGFAELLVIGVVALLVLGPERLPAAARTVGGVLRKARQSWVSVRNEFERELAIEDMKRNARELRERVEAGNPTATVAAAGIGDEPPPGQARVPDRAPHD